MKTIIKPWGKEEWIELNDKYCYKRIYINSGYKTSYQYHNFKKETNYIISGEAEIWLENSDGVIEKKLMKAGDFFNVTPPKKHRVIALTDLILQEVSTPEVDDVIRIEDDNLRGNGKIESEHMTPAVLILAAGFGTRLNDLTANINKALIPVDNKAIISHIIKKFPEDYEFIIAIGYKGDSIKDYCKIVFPKHKFTFVEVENISGEYSGPGVSALACKNLLQRPFYLITCDCLVTDTIPHIDGNWLGVSKTCFPEKYSTIEIDSNNFVKSFKNKSSDGNEFAFIGLASILDFNTFWEELSQNMKNGEVVSAFENVLNYKNLKVKQIKWFDTGNIDDLLHAKKYFEDVELSLKKDNGEITYYDNSLFLKLIPNKNLLLNKFQRADKLKDLIPENLKITDNFLVYKWEEGKTLYEIDNIDIYKKFLQFFNCILDNSNFYNENIETIDKFYYEKTKNRVNLFIEKYGNEYYNNSYVINGVTYPSLKSIFEKIDFSIFYQNQFYEKFHGDLQFDNIIYNTNNQKFKYIDWRDSFADKTNGGDLYYDLAKMYGGILIPYNLMKNSQNISFQKGIDFVIFDYKITDTLKSFEQVFTSNMRDRNIDIKKLNILVGLIFLNMSPLHDEDFGKLLWFKSIQKLSEYVD